MLIKVTDQSQSTSKSISVTECEPFSSFKEKAEKKLGFKVERFFCREVDEIEIDDDETLWEILKMSPRPPATVHCLVALKSNETVAMNDENNNNLKTSNKVETIATSEVKSSLNSVDSVGKELNEISIGKTVSSSLSKSVMASATAGKMEELKKQEESLKKKIEAKNEEIEATERIESFENKIKKLQDEYNQLLYKSIKTEEIRTTELRKAELRKVELKIRQTKISKLFLELRLAEHVDICFMMDCTGSMSSYIEEAKTVVHRVVEKLVKRFQDLKLRCAFVGYRDHCDKENRVQVLPFTSDKNVFKEYVTSIRAMGGGDTPEDIFGGLEEVNKLKWEKTTRVLFHIGDAACHGRNYHNYADDDYPDGDPRNLNINTLLAGLASKCIDYYFAEINEGTQKMIGEFNEILVKSQGNEINVVKLSDSTDLVDSVAWSLSSSIMNSKSLSVSEAKGKPLKTYEVDRSAITDWRSLSVAEYKLEAELYETSFRSDLDNIMDNEVEYSRRKVDVYLAKKPFAKGALRFAFAALVNMGTKERPNLVRCVMKESAFKDEKYNTEEYMKSQIEVQVVSKFLAEKFMSKLSGGETRLKFLTVNMIRVPTTGVFYSCEEYVPGSFTKWTNNAGIVNEDDYAMVLNAFSHWSYQATNGYLIVSDLQGFRSDGGEYVLTDPAISCNVSWDRFSSTNLASKGIDKFFKSHHCNEICTKLGLLKK